MKEKLGHLESKKISGYVRNIKNNLKRKFTHYKVNKTRELYRDGLRFEEQAEYPEAIHNYKACIQAEPQNIKYLRRLANLYSSLEENTKALTLFLEIVKILPNEETFFQLGQEFFRQNKYKKSIEYLKKSLQYNKRYISSHLLLATVYSKVGNVDKTEQYLTNALKLDPNHKTSLEELMKFYYKQNRFRDSLQLMNQYTSIYAEDSKIKLLKVDLYMKTGSYTNALKILYIVTSSNESFSSFINEMELRKNNPTPREKEFINRITTIKNQKLVSFKMKLQNYYNERSVSVPNPKDSFDLSFLYLLLGNQKKALKYLLFARQLNEEKKYY
ncbi:MAG: hypothetical protein IPL26_21595 [Leptospiraceae bacterium]|nr:hypothetical protein [Leptospiraceae bacterium]